LPKRKINLGGQEFEVDSVEFEAERESWNSYVLHDGTTLRLKAVVSEILRVVGQWAPNGDPVYMVQASNVVVTTVPDNLKKKG